MIDEGKGFEMVVNASEPDREAQLRQCAEDLWGSVEEGCLRLETPRGSVGQTDIHGLGIEYKPSTLHQPWAIVGIDFDIRLEDDELSRIARDLQDHELTLAAYGDRHVWELSKVWHQECSIDIDIGMENPVQSVSVEFMSAAEVDWRW